MPQGCDDTQSSSGTLALKHSNDFTELQCFGPDRPSIYCELLNICKRETDRERLFYGGTSNKIFYYIKHPTKLKKKKLFCLLKFLAFILFKPKHEQLI